MNLKDKETFKILCFLFKKQEQERKNHKCGNSSRWDLSFIGC